MPAGREVTSSGWPCAGGKAAWVSGGQAAGERAGCGAAAHLQREHLRHVALDPLARGAARPPGRADAPRGRAGGPAATPAAILAAATAAVAAMAASSPAPTRTHAAHGRRSATPECGRGPRLIHNLCVRTLDVEP